MQVYRDIQRAGILCLGANNPSFLDASLQDSARHGYFKYSICYEGSILFVQCNLHSVPMLFLALDFICHSFCFHHRHAVFLVVLVVLYLAINMGTSSSTSVYSLLVTPIYAPLKWVDVSSYLLAVGCIVAVLVVHFLARLLFRRWKVSKLEAKVGPRASLLSRTSAVS